MNPQYFLDSTEVLLIRHERTENIETADCLEAIAQCIRIIAKTDPTIGAIIWSGVKLARGEASSEIAEMLEQRATKIRLEARKNNGKSIAGIRR